MSLSTGNPLLILFKLPFFVVRCLFVLIGDLLLIAFVMLGYWLYIVPIWGSLCVIGGVIWTLILLINDASKEELSKFASSWLQERAEDFWEVPRDEIAMGIIKDRTAARLQSAHSWLLG
jgi:hypothetical protein